MRRFCLFLIISGDICNRNVRVTYVSWCTSSSEQGLRVAAVISSWYLSVSSGGISSGKQVAVLLASGRNSTHPNCLLIFTPIHIRIINFCMSPGFSVIRGTLKIMTVEYLILGLSIGPSAA